MLIREKLVARALQKPCHPERVLCAKDQCNSPRTAQVLRFAQNDKLEICDSERQGSPRETAPESRVRS